MLVKVGLSYYMEGEHRQGVSLTRVSAWGQLTGGRAMVMCELRSSRRVGLHGPTSRHPKRAGPLLP